MISQIEIRNFQSLRHVALELSPLTVIVGASSSGKSAFTRALKTLTGNQRGHAFITHGERITTIKAVTDRGTITLKRGKSTDDNEYVTIPSEDPSGQIVYTKLAGTVPEEVSAFIGIAAKDPLNFAGQFDRPYLLDDSGSEVARVLGSLTNVSIIFEAARESNRQKLSQAGLLKTRATDFAVIKEKIEDYRPLKNQLLAVTEAEKNLATVLQLRTSITKIARHIEILDLVSGVLVKLETILASPLPDIAPIIAQQRRIKILSSHTDAWLNAELNLGKAETILALHVPDAATIATAAARLKHFQSVISTVKGLQGTYRTATADLAAAEAEEAELTDKYTEMLITAGTCPTCQQSTNELEHTHA